MGIPLDSRVTDAEAVGIHEGSIEVHVLDLVPNLDVVQVVQPDRCGEDVGM